MNMNRNALCLAAALFLVAGCASSSNQKFAAPLLGTVKNEYVIYNLAFDKDMSEGQISNVVRQVRSLASSETSEGRRQKIVVGRGSSLIAVDNQVLVGRDIGNVSSNEVSASASIPIGL